MAIPFQGEGERIPDQTWTDIRRGPFSPPQRDPIWGHHRMLPLIIGKVSSEVPVIHLHFFQFHSEHCLLWIWNWGNFDGQLRSSMLGISLAVPLHSPLTWIPSQLPFRQNSKVCQHLRSCGPEILAAFTMNWMNHDFFGYPNVFFAADSYP